MSNILVKLRERKLCLYTKVLVKDTKLKCKENISYLIIKTNEKYLIGNCTSKLLTTGINS